MSEITEQVSQLIRETRKAKGLTQQEMANKLDISKSAYSRYEAGKQNLTVDTLYKIGQVFGMNLLISYT